MTPGARVAAAISILNAIRDGQAAEQALTSWARGSRFAGSKDRAAVRDHVFDVLRARRSLGDGTGRELMIRLCQRDGLPLDALFSGDGHAPERLTDTETLALNQPDVMSVAAQHDLPEWLWPIWQDSLGAEASEAALVQQQRAAVFLRVNLRRCSPSDAILALAADSISAVAHPTLRTCLVVTENSRRIKTSAAYLDGLVELQDAASQFAIGMVPVKTGARLLDYCAGGGGKALGFADMNDATVFAHDIASRRMADLPVRAARAKVSISCVETDDLAKNGRYDVVFCDAPCSGSGTWRRTPDAKWRLTQTDLTKLTTLQSEVISAAAALVAPGGILAYATCSVLRPENDDIVNGFCAAQQEWEILSQHHLVPSLDGDGFFLSLLRRL